MSYLTLNGYDLERACITLPRYGAWTADVEHLDTSAVEVGGAATLVFGSQTFIGTVVRVQSNEAPGFDTRIVGGAGGLSTLLSPRQFQNPTARNVLDAALSDGGETLSTTADTTALTKSLPRWERSQRTLGQELDAIAAAVGLEWRVLIDGTIWLGTPSWSAASVADYDVMELNADRALLLIAAEDPTVLPGQALEGIRAGLVIHRIEPEGTRTEIYADSGTDRAVGMLDALIRRGQPVDLHAFYKFQVLSQNADKTLELRTLDSRLSDISKVPMRFGIPGALADIPAGHVVMVGFASGNEQDPYVANWASGTPTSVAFPVGSLLHLGASAGADFVALAGAVLTELQTLKTWLDTHIHVDPLSGATGVPVVLSPAPGSMAATKVKAT